MPQFGLLTKDQIGRRATGDPNAFPGRPWKLPGADVVYVTYEVDVEATLALMPEQLSRPVPPYARLSVTRYPESPIGPYSEALLMLSGRFAMLPRSYIVAAVVTTEKARDAYGAIWALPAAVGTVDLQRKRNPDGTDTITARIGAGSPLATVSVPEAYTVEPAMVRYDPLVSVRTTESGEAELIQFSGAPTIHEGRLSKGASVTCQTDAWADPWFRLRSLNMISATFAVADMELTDPVVQQPPRAGGGMGGGTP